MVSVVAGNRCFMVSVAGFLVDSAAARGSIFLERIERLLAFRVFRTGFRRWFVYGFRRGRKAFLFVVYGFRRFSFLWFPSWQGTFCLLWFPSLVF